MANSNSPYSGSPTGVVTFERSPSNPTVPLAAAPAAVHPAPAKPKSKPRKRVNTAEKRHQHNAIERQRRETLNGKFLGLARLLPSLASHRRPSKSAIVNGSIAHLTHQRDQRLLAARLLRQLCAERDALAKECNEWRVANNFQPKDLGSAWTEEMEQVCDVEKEVFGTFATMQEDGDDDDQESNNAVEMPLEQATSFVASSINSSNGLITPRSSTDLDPIAHALSMKPQEQQQPSIGANWSTQFAFNPTNGSLTNSTASLPFSAFMSDGLDSLCGSPTNSQHTNGGISTPPTTAEFGAFTHTPSPRSTNSFEEVSQANPWTEQQMLFLQSVQQQQLQQRQASVSSQQSVHQMPNQGLNPMLFNNSFNNAGYTDSNAFTQTLIASMFPQQSNVHVGNGNNNIVLPQQPPQHPSLSRAQTENMEAWRKLAIGGMMSRGNDSQPSVAELKNAIRTGMGIGMNMGNGMWEQGAVKGF